MATMFDEIPVVKQGVKDLKLITSTLYQVVAGLYGPKTQQALLVTSTGQVIMSCDGPTVLSSLHLSHPVAKSIVDTVFSYSSVYGDGSKTLLIYLHGIVCAVENAHRSEGDAGSEDSFKCKVAKWLQEFVIVDLPLILEDLKSRVYSVNEPIMGTPLFVRQCVTEIVQSCFDSSVVNSNVSQLVSLGTSFLVESVNNPERVGEIAHMASENFEDLVFCQAGMPFESSFVGKGFHGAGKISKAGISSSGKLVCVQCPFEVSDFENKRYILHASLDISDNLISHRYVKACEFLGALKDSGVSFLLTSVKVPSFVLQICLSYGISVGVLDDDSSLQFFISLSNCSPVVSLNYGTFTKNVINVAAFESISDGTKTYVKVLFPEDSSVVNPQCLFLCAPTDSLASQLKSVFWKSVKSVNHCLFASESKYVSSGGDGNRSKRSAHSFSSSVLGTSLVESRLDFQEQDSLSKALIFECAQNCVRGGGSFDSLLFESVHKYIQTSPSKEKLFCCKLLIRMLEGVLKLMHKKAMHEPRGIKKGVFALRKGSHSRAHDSACGIAHDGQVCQSVRGAAVDVLRIKVAAVVTAIQLTVKLLRIHSIIGVKRIYLEEEAGEISAGEAQS